LSDEADRKGLNIIPEFINLFILRLLSHFISLTTTLPVTRGHI